MQSGHSLSSAKQQRKNNLMNATDVLKYGHGTVLQTIVSQREAY
jgi:hypothetical protein